MRELERVFDVLDALDKVERFLEENPGPERRAFQCFYALRPLREGKARVGEITVEKWMRRGLDEVCSWELLPVLRKHGEELKKLVRTEVREEFSRLVDLSKELIPYREVRAEVKFREPMRVWLLSSLGGISIGDALIDSIAVQVGWHYHVYLMREGYVIHNPSLKELDLSKNLLLVMQLADHLLELYRLLRARLEEAARHNEEVLKEMEEVVAPYLVASTIGR